MAIAALLAVIAVGDAAAVDGPAGQTAGAGSELGRAFAAAFHAPPPATLASDAKGADAVTLSYRPAALVKLERRFALISEGRAPEAGHPQSGALGVHYLRKARGGFQVTGAWPVLAQGRGFGEPPTWRVRRDLFANPGLEVETGYTGQGCTTSSIELIELARGQPMRRAVVATGVDDATTGRSWTATIAPRKKGASFWVEYSGDVRGRVKYSLRRDRYVPAIMKKLPSC